MRLFIRTFPARLILLVLLAVAMSACGNNLQEASRLARSDDPEDIQKAVTIYEKELKEVLEAYEDNLTARQALAQALMKRGLYGSAIPHLEYVLRMAPTAPGARLDYAIALANLSITGEATYDEAKAAYRRAIDAAPASEKAYYGLAALERFHGHPAEAVDWLERAIALEPEYADAHILKARLHVDAGDLSAAAAHYQVGLANTIITSPRRVELIRSYAAVLRALGDFDEAKRIESQLPSAQ